MGVNRLRSPITYSIAIHILFVALLMFFAAHEVAQNHPTHTTWIQLEAVPQKLAHPPKLNDDSRNRVVQTARGHETKEAAPNAFLGERTQTVDRQTVAKSRTTSVGKSAAAPRTAKTEARPKTGEKTPSPQVAQMPALNKLGLAMLPSPNTHPPGEEELARERAVPQDGVGTPQDYVKGLKESETTALSTREYVFFGYFQRIRQRLDHAWNGSLKDHLDRFYRSGRHLASEMDHTTRILVTLNSGGEVVRVQVLEESGTRDLDDAAIGAFNQAGPFPNPPRGILNSSGIVQIRWDFILRT